MILRLQHEPKKANLVSIMWHTIHPETIISNYRPFTQKNYITNVNFSHRTVCYILLKLVWSPSCGWNLQYRTSTSLLKQMFLHSSGQTAIRRLHPSACKHQHCRYHNRKVFISLNLKKEARSSTACTVFSRAQLQHVQISPKYNFIGHPVLVIEAQNSRSRLVSLREAALWR